MRPPRRKAPTAHGRSATATPRPRPAKLGQHPEDPVPVDLAVRVAADELGKRVGRRVWFTGELVQLKSGRSGNGYGVLKSRGVRIDLYLPPGRMRATRDVALGTLVLIQGRLRIWEPGGRFEIAASTPLIATASPGVRAEARRAAEDELRRAGVFDRTRRQLPPWPGEVAVVTSGQGAAIHDVRATIRRRAPWVAIRLHDCVVQGPGAAVSIIAALDAADRSTADVIVLTRGGGEADAFDPFDEPAVVRRLASARLPVIVAVGHESDRTLADLASDCSASTPTAAAERAVPDGAAVRSEPKKPSL